MLTLLCSSRLDYLCHILFSPGKVLAFLWSPEFHVNEDLLYLASDLHLSHLCLYVFVVFFQHA